MLDPGADNKPFRVVIGKARNASKSMVEHVAVVMYFTTNLLGDSGTKAFLGAKGESAGEAVEKLFVASMEVVEDACREELRGLVPEKGGGEL